MDDSPASDDDLGETFGLVANEIRYEIIRTLWDADGAPLEFSELYDRVAIGDSGQFNYPLDKLVPEFVRKRENGYELTHAGQQVVGAAVSGAYTDSDIQIEPIPADDCPNCGATIEAEYERGFMRIACTSCEMLITDSLRAPPIVVSNTDPGAVPDVLNRYLLAKSGLASQGFCWLCRGPLARSIDLEDPTFDRDAMSDHLEIEVVCRACGNQFSQFVSWLVFDHPAVVRFLDDHGIDVRTAPVWELYSVWMGEPHATIQEQDPLRIEVTLDIDGETLHLTLDGEFDVIGSSRGS